MRTLLRILIAVAFSTCMCQKKDTAVPPVPAPVPEVKKVEFVPPADSSISADQAEKWLSCHELLDSLSYLYQDSFKTEDAAKRLTYQTDFVDAQDRVCVLSGLRGGYDEYRWVLENLGNPRNKLVAESVGITVH